MIAEITRRWDSPTRCASSAWAEPVPAELLDRVRNSGSVERLVTGYGMTECTCYSTATVVFDRNASSVADPASAARVPRLNDIGAPIANTQLYVLDPGLQPVPIGIPGELYIGGVGLAGGYQNQPGWTAARFVPDPFAADQTLYRTGDRVRWTPEGSLEFLGRFDDQVKLRGLRIELGEVEAALATNPAVAQCVVVLPQHPPAAGSLVAYWVPRGEVHATPASLRDHLRDRLPAYMVPSAFVTLDRLPLTSNGKINRQALPRPVPDGLTTEPTSVEPGDPIQAELTRIWSELLGIETVRIRDNFFELGGDSLKALRLFARIELVFGRRLSPAHIYQASTVEELAAELRAGSSDHTGSHVIPVRVAQTRPFFCLPGGGDPGMRSVRAGQAA